VNPQWQPFELLRRDLGHWASFVVMSAIAVLRQQSHSRVGGGALARWPPSAAQTASADFPRAAFTKT